MATIEEPPPRGQRESSLEEAPVHIPNLPLGPRIMLLVVGWFLLAVGLLGLVLPGLQGVVTIALALAILSVASNSVHRVLELLLERQPHLRRKLDRLRQAIHRRLVRHR